MQRAADHLEAPALDGVVEPIILARRLLRAQSDARLVELAAEGHERPFEIIVERYRRPLERYCARFLAPAMAEDVVQQVFLAAWLALRDGTQVRSLRGWLYRIARNAALAAAHSAESDCMPLRDSDRCADAADSVVERRATVRETLAALATLPERQREALLRIAVESRSPGEVADELGLSQNALRQLVFRARSALRAAACAVTSPHLAAWAASLGQAGSGAATTTATGGALLKAGAAALAAAAVAASTATLVEHPDGARDAPAAAVERPTTGEPDMAHAGVAPTAVPGDSMAPPLRDDRSRRRASRPAGEVGLPGGPGPARSGGPVQPSDEQGLADAGHGDGANAPKSDADLGDADLPPDGESEQQASASGEGSPDPEGASGASEPPDGGDPAAETDESESDEPAPEAAMVEDAAEPETGDPVRNGAR